MTATTLATMRRILVPIDFSPTGVQAISRAAEVAARWGATLELLHVMDGPAWSRRRKNDKGAQLHERTRSLSDPKAVWDQVERKIVQGNPAQKILSEAQDGSFDLIVMGTRGRTGLGRLLHTSVSEEVSRRAPCPVLIVGPGVNPAADESESTAGSSWCSKVRARR